MAKLKAWRLFPEHKRNASATSVCRIQFAEYDWENDRFIVVKHKKWPAIPALLDEEPNQDFNNDWQIEEGAQ
jgi:hypothetical protein